MANWKYFYLIRIEFLGFRYHGWQKQPDHKSVHGMIDKTFDFIFQHQNYRTLGCGRTDAKVSADDFALELFTMEEQIPVQLKKRMNANLPTDIRVKEIIKVSPEFNVIKSVSWKEYHYFFSFGEKYHPFNAPFMYDFGKKLDIELMQKAAKEYEGVHNFKRFASNSSEETVVEREIFSAEIVRSDKYNGPYAPENDYVFKVKGEGFMRYQVRLMMGALVEVGRKVWTIEDLLEKMENPNGKQVKLVAPSSGLVLHKVEYSNI